MLRPRQHERSIEERAIAFGSDPATEPRAELDTYALRGRGDLLGRAGVAGGARPEAPRHFSRGRGPRRQLSPPRSRELWEVEVMKARFRDREMNCGCFA